MSLQEQLREMKMYIEKLELQISLGYTKKINNNIRLLVRLPQSGKTEIMLNSIVNFIQEAHNPLVVIICDNSLLLTTQTLYRGNKKISIKIGKISCDANKYCEWKKYKGVLDSPADGSEGHRLSERIAACEVNTIVVCSNKIRWNDIENIIEDYKTTHDIQLWIDEADKTVGGVDGTNVSVRKKISNMNNWKTEINSINLITATPFTPKNRWQNFKWIGEKLGGIVELVKIPEITGEGYHHLCDSNWVEQDDGHFENTEDYAEAYLRINTPSSGDVWLIPGETNQDSHEKIKNMCLKYFDYVIIINGNTKIIIDSNGSIIYNLRDQNCVLPCKKEISEWFSEFYKSHKCSEKTIAITGNLCISRGITISSDTCQISHLIFGCDSKIREEEQLMSRVCGYCYSDIIPTVICSRKAWENVSKYQEVVIELSKIALLDDEKERILDEEKFNAIIQKIDGHKRVPFMFEGFDGSEDIFVEKKLNKKQKFNFFMSRIEDINPGLAKFIKESNCKQITMPKENGSYKRHVEDVYRKVQEKKNFIIDFTPEEKEHDCWMGIIDSRQNRFFIITWVIDSTYI